MIKRYVLYVKYKSGEDFETYSDDLEKLLNYYLYTQTNKKMRECYIWDNLDKDYIVCSMLP